MGSAVYSWNEFDDRRIQGWGSIDSIRGRHVARLDELKNGGLFLVPPFSLS